MKTTIFFKSGNVLEHPDAAPSFEFDESREVLPNVRLIDANNFCVSDDIPLERIRRVVFDVED